MSGQARRERDYRKFIEARGHTVLGLDWGKGGHGKMRVRLSSGREGTLPFPSSPSAGEQVCMNLLKMHLRALERGPATGSRDCVSPTNKDRP